MSCHIVLSTWSGNNPDEAAVKLAKVFRIQMERSKPILQMLKEGKPWQFQFKISEQQANSAASYLRRLGFGVDCLPFIEDQTPVAVEEIDPEATQTVAAPAMQMEFTGTGGELFGIFLTNLLKNIFTLGIYHFWAKTRTRHYVWSKTSFAGDHFSYHGTGAELFKGFIKFFGVLIVLSGFSVLAEIYGGVDQDLTSGLLSIPILIFFPALLVGAWRYRLSRTAWRGIRFSFRGKRMQAVGIYFKGYLLTVLTLGVYWPYFRMQTEKFWRENSFFGDKKFGFTGEGKEIFGQYLIAAPLTVLTLGLYWIWFKAYLHRYYWAHTRLGGGNFRFTANGLQWFGLYFINLMILVFTLGLGYSWVVVRTRKFIASYLTLEGNVNLNRVIQEMKKSGAFGEEALDAFDIPVDIG